MPRTVMKTATPPWTPASWEEMAELQTISKNSPWKELRRSSSKITPRESSPYHGLPAKVVKELVLKSCLKKPSDGLSPPLSLQSSMRGEITEDGNDEKNAQPFSGEVAIDAELRNQKHNGNAYANTRRRLIPVAFIEAVLP